MKKILVVVLSVSLVFFLFAGTASVVFAQKVMRLAETHPQDYPTTKGTMNSPGSSRSGPMGELSSNFSQQTVG